MTGADDSPDTVGVTNFCSCCSGGELCKVSAKQIMTLDSHYGANKNRLILLYALFYHQDETKTSCDYISGAVSLSVDYCDGRDLNMLTVDRYCKDSQVYCKFTSKLTAFLIIAS